MRVVNLAYANICNTATGLSRALRTAGHEARSIVLQPAPYDMDVDLMWSRDEAACREVLDGADSLHLHSLAPGFTMWLTRLPFRLPQVVRGRRCVVHYHGGDMRRILHPSVKALIARHRLPTAVTVPDLLPYLPGSTWLPIPAEPDAPEYARAEPPASPIRICHAPSTRSVKKTDAFLAAVERLRATYDVEPVLIENKPFAECLAIKRTCHLNFDNIGYGSYGAATLESLLMEQPSLAYLDAASLAAVSAASAEVGIECPIVQVGDPRQPSHADLNAILEGKGVATHTPADVDSIVRALEPLIEDDGRRRDVGRRSRRWAAAVHGDARVGRLAAGLHERAPVVDGFGAAERLEQIFWWGYVSARQMVKEKRTR